MDKHTSRPWEHQRMRLTPKDKDRRCGFVVNGPDDGSKELPIRVCDLRVPAGVDGYSTGEANARLIAAAPDLLAALEQLAKIGDDGVIERRETGKPTWSALDTVKAISRAAIAKATGQGVAS